jgi:hypothetical protein
MNLELSIDIFFQQYCNLIFKKNHHNNLSNTCTTLFILHHFVSRVYMNYSYMIRKGGIYVFGENISLCQKNKTKTELN